MLMIFLKIQRKWFVLCMESQRRASLHTLSMHCSPSTSAKQKDLMAKLIGANSSWLPPSQAVLLQKSLWTNYIVAWWKNACKQDLLSEFNAGPTECGWELKDGKYRILWYVGDQLPADIVNKLVTSTRNRWRWCHGIGFRWIWVWWLTFRSTLVADLDEICPWAHSVLPKDIGAPIYICGPHPLFYMEYQAEHLLYINFPHMHRFPWVHECNTMQLDI